jgi:hypothetical protein
MVESRVGAWRDLLERAAVENVAEAQVGHPRSVGSAGSAATAVQGRQRFSAIVRCRDRPLRRSQRALAQ